MTHSLSIATYEMNRRHVQRDEELEFQKVMHSANWFDGKCVGD